MLLGSVKIHKGLYTAMVRSWFFGFIGSLSCWFFHGIRDWAWLATFLSWFWVLTWIWITNGGRKDTWNFLDSLAVLFWLGHYSTGQTSNFNRYHHYLCFILIPFKCIEFLSISTHVENRESTFVYISIKFQNRKIWRVPSRAPSTPYDNLVTSIEVSAVY